MYQSDITLPWYHVSEWYNFVWVSCIRVIWLWLGIMYQSDMTVSGYHWYMIPRQSYMTLIHDTQTQLYHSDTWYPDKVISLWYMIPRQSYIPLIHDTQTKSYHSDTWYHHVSELYNFVRVSCIRVIWLCLGIMYQSDMTLSGYHVSEWYNFVLVSCIRVI
jgi:hypothetical protein